MCLCVVIRRSLLSSRSQTAMPRSKGKRRTTETSREELKARVDKHVKAASLEFHVNWLANKHSVHIRVCVDGVVEMWGKYSKELSCDHKHALDIQHLFVYENFRRQGWATYVLDQIEEMVSKRIGSHLSVVFASDAVLKQNNMIPFLKERIASRGGGREFTSHIGDGELHRLGYMPKAPEKKDQEI